MIRVSLTHRFSNNNPNSRNSNNSNHLYIVSTSPIYRSLSNHPNNNFHQCTNPINLLRNNNSSNNKVSSNRC